MAFTENRETKPARPGQYVLTLACPDRTGIVHAVAAYLHEAGGNIADSQQFGDPYSGRFFMRVHVNTGASDSLDKLRDGFAAVADGFG
ncbi:MAG: ACT domain-containing protein, partial [Mycobacteriales bacterium]